MISVPTARNILVVVVLVVLVLALILVVLILALVVVLIVLIVLVVLILAVLAVLRIVRAVVVLIVVHFFPHILPPVRLPGLLMVTGVVWEEIVKNMPAFSGTLVLFSVEPVTKYLHKEQHQQNRYQYGEHHGNH